MKKIALMTWYDNENYGTALQAYALQDTISEYAECEIIPYKSKHPGYGLKDIINPVLRKNLCWKVYERTILKFFEGKYLLPEKERYVLMQDYFCKKLKFVVLDSEQDLLNKVNQEYDAVVCGSDQIWNPTRYDSHFFLDYVKDEILKIAYAPSFGVSEFQNNEVKKEISEQLTRFDYLSVRENAGQKIIWELLNKKVPVCLDPTLLKEKEFWLKLAEESKIEVPDKYVYCYLLGRNKKHLKSAKTISKTLGIRLVQQPYNIVDYMNGVDLVPPSGPADFLKAIKNSEFVCTDSFHGAIFAIIFEKPFVVFKRFNCSNKASQNSRVETLLQTVGMEDRLKLSANSSMKELLDISFEDCKEKLCIARRESKSFLKNAIEGVAHRGDN